MKTLLHNPVTHLFLKSLGEWTLDPNDAMQFEEISDAERFRDEHHVHGAQLFLRFAPPDYEAIEHWQGERHLSPA